MPDLNLKSSYLRINDIELRVPPESITIIKNDFNATVSTLRSPTSTQIKTGRRTVSIIIDTYFSSGYDAVQGTEVDGNTWINQELAPLLLQTRKFPFVSIENEKIRNEIVGDFINLDIDGVDKINLAAIVKQIDVSSNARTPDTLDVRIHLELFNYSPFSKDFKYKQIGPDGVSSAIDVPGNQFSAFIESNTLIQNNSGIPISINSLPSDYGRDLEFIFKEYIRVDLESVNFQQEINKIKNFSFDQSENIQVPLKSSNDKVEQIISTLAQEGWQKLDDTQAVGQEAGSLFFRYRRFSIKDIDPSQVIESGRLIVESFNLSLQTKTPIIPLLGHTIPTSQFLGASDGAISLNLFANAELEGGVNDGKPVGSSSQLAKLNSIIEVVNRNAVAYRRVSKNDVIFIKHPAAKLLKYKKYDEQTLTVVDYTKDGKLYIDTFDTSDYLACTIQGTESQTIPGLPYCSRFSIVMTENYRSSRSNISEENSGPSNRVYESAKDFAKKVAKKFQMVKQGNLFVIPPGAPVGDPDYFIAQKLLVYLNHSLFAKENKYQTPDEVIDDRSLVEKRSRELASEFSYLDPGLKFLSSDRLNEISYDILNLLAKTEFSTAADDPPRVDPRLSIYEAPANEFKGYNTVKVDSNYPDMLLPDERMQPDFFFFNESDQSSNKTKRELLKSVRERYREVAEQYANNAANADAGKKIDENFLGSPGPVVEAANVVGREKTKRGEEADTDKQFIQSPLDENQQFSSIQKAISDFQTNTYTMRRAMPTFRLYVKDGDVGSLTDIDKDRVKRTVNKGIWRNFSDFYDLNGIIDIRLVKQKDNPADLLIIRMTNTREDIVNKFFDDPFSPLARRKFDQQKTKPKGGSSSGKNLKADLNELDGVILKEGTRIELRLGYDANPNNLTTEFSGRIAQVGGGDVVEIICQGDGIELIQELKGVGEVDTFSWNSDTGNIISELLHNSPEVTNFGTINARSFLGENPLMWRGAGGRTAVENIFAPSLYGSWDNFGSKTIKYASFGASLSLLTAGVTAPALAAIGGAIGLAGDIKDAAYTFFKGSPFTIYEQTIWDVLQELTMRHPGVICSVVPFDRRSTIFFGYPDQLYFYRGPSYYESIALYDDPNREGLFGNERNMQEIYAAKGAPLQQGRIGKKNTKKKNLSSTISSVQTYNAVNPENGKPYFETNDDEDLIPLEPMDISDIYMGFIKPFRNYHMITSEHHIIENNLTVNSDGVFNSIQVVYPKSSDEGNFDGSVGFSNYEKTDEIKADDDLNKEYIKRQTLVFHNAHNDVSGLELPEKYAVSNLCRSLNNVYKGKIKILGRNNIKPYDIVYLYDSYNNIYGAIEVASIVHIFSYDTGWITEITPHMIVTPTTSTAIIHVDAIKKLAHAFFLKDMKSFYASHIFNDFGDISSTSAGERIGKNALKGGGFGLGVAGSALALQSTGLAAFGAEVGTDAASKVAAGRKLSKGLETAEKVGVASKVAGKIAQGTTAKVAAQGGLKVLLGRLVGSSLPILGSLGIDYLIGAYTSWSKYRQPIVFLPVIRNGKPWYTGLYGLNNNTQWDAITGDYKKLLDEGGYVWDYLRDEFPTIIE